MNDNQSQSNADATIQSQLVAADIHSSSQSDEFLSEIDRNQNQNKDLDGIFTGAITDEKIDGKIYGILVENPILGILYNKNFLLRRYFVIHRTFPFGKRSSDK